jgi:hypothetical protein
MKTLRVASILLALAASGCVGRQIVHLEGCRERLEIPHKRAECNACIERPFPHKYLPDNPDGERCVRR